MEELRAGDPDLISGLPHSHPDHPDPNRFRPGRLADSPEADACHEGVIVFARR